MTCPCVNLTPAQIPRRRWFRVKSTFYELRSPLWEWLGRVRCKMFRVSRYVITMPAVSYARELWRYGEPDLAHQAARMSPSRCADVGERAGQLHTSGAAADLWPDGPRGVTSAILLAVIESLEGKARPCARSRRLAETSLPDDWRLTEEQRWEELAPVARDMDARLHSEK